MRPLGTIKRLDPRTLWNNESADFTPWLAENISGLGGALGLDLELQSTEAPVGDFSLDILARELGRDRLVVIENQLAPTDHDHLGKLLTYASGYDASTVVWIAPEIREEHRQAIDWLNTHSDEDTEFFAVLVEVLQIGDSPPAVEFRPVAAPNTWRKEKKAARGSGQPSRRGEAYQRFFQELIDILRQRKFTNARKAAPSNWCAFGSGVSGIGYNPSFALGRRCRTEVYIDYGSAEANLAILKFLESRKDLIEGEIGEALEWESLEGKRACRIAVYRDGSIDDPPETLSEIRDWYVDLLLRFREVFGPLIPEATSTADSSAGS